MFFHGGLSCSPFSSWEHHPHWASGRGQRSGWPLGAPGWRWRPPWRRRKLALPQAGRAELPWRKLWGELHFNLISIWFQQPIKAQQFSKSCHWLEECSENICFINSSDNKSQSYICRGAAFQVPRNLSLILSALLSHSSLVIELSPWPLLQLSSLRPIQPLTPAQQSTAKRKTRLVEVGESEGERKSKLVAFILHHPLLNTYWGLSTQPRGTVCSEFSGLRKV